VTDTLKSSAPHIYDACISRSRRLGRAAELHRGPSKSSGRLLFKGPNNEPETGLWVVHAGRLAAVDPARRVLPLSSRPRDLYARYRRGDRGAAGTCVHFNAGWTGTCVVHETLRNVYMLR
jgi:uncharacterized cupin superfamily protein